MNAAALKVKSLGIVQSDRRYSLDEYLERENKALNKHEFINGQIKRMAGAKAKHNEITSNMIGALKYTVRPLPVKFRVYNSDQKIYIASENLGVYPDAVVVCREPEFWQNREELLVNPLLIVEVSSKSTRSYDRAHKLDLYRLLPSFEEYVLVEQNKPAVESWYKIAPDTWQVTKETNLAESIALRSLGVSIPLAEIYEHISFTELPKTTK